MYLLDTNIISALQKNNQNVISKIIEVGFDQISICTVVLAECYFGAYKNKVKSQKLIEYYNNAFIDVNIYDFDINSSVIFAQIKAGLSTKGLVVADLDLQIASIAISNNLILVTNNTKDFINIKGLVLEDWS
jgi:tRNA(fMet)-specific endonuclease VapC